MQFRYCIIELITVIGISQYGPYADFKLYQVQKERHTLHGAIFLKIMCEKLCSLHIYNHSYKYNGKIVLFSIL